MALTVSLLAFILFQGADQAATMDVSGQETVRDHLWAWSHDAGVYNGAWGLPGISSMTPVDGARFLGVPNVIFIRYGEKPKPPFEDYFKPFAALKRVCWSIAGAGGATSEAEREHVYRLAAAHPNITALFMDDFFQFNMNDAPQWLAENETQFPVMLTVALETPVLATSLEIAQSAWGTGDYRSGDFVVEVFSESGQWLKVGKGRLPNAPGAAVRVMFTKVKITAFRVSILNTQDKGKALSCGLSRIRLYSDDGEVALTTAKARASSTYPGHGAEMLVSSRSEVAPASLSVEQLEGIRGRMASLERSLPLGVTLYTHQLDPSIIPHLEHCDIISLWTWKSEELKDLEHNMARLKTMMPAKRIWLGCYMWDFGVNQPMPVDRMQRQCELGLKWLKGHQVEGIIFLATNLCDLNLETVEWTRQWIARVGDEPL